MEVCVKSHPAFPGGPARPFRAKFKNESDYHGPSVVLSDLEAALDDAAPFASKDKAFLDVLEDALEEKGVSVRRNATARCSTSDYGKKIAKIDLLLSKGSRRAAVHLVQKRLSGALIRKYDTPLDYRVALLKRPPSKDDGVCEVEGIDVIYRLGVAKNTSSETPQEQLLYKALEDARAALRAATPGENAKDCREIVASNLRRFGFEVSIGSSANEAPGRLDVTAERDCLKFAFEVDRRSVRAKSANKLLSFRGDGRFVVIREPIPGKDYTRTDGLEVFVLSPDTVSGQGGGKGEGSTLNPITPTEGNLGSSSLRSEESSIAAQKRVSERKSKLDPERLRAAQSRDSARARKLQRKTRSVVKRSATSRPLDWSQLDQQGNPSISFDPGNPLRSKILVALGRSPHDRLRRALVGKLGKEFGRIYERYRKDVERRQRGISSYQLTSGERKACEAAGVLCIQRGVTPRQVLEYWHKNIGQFTDGSLVIPPLSILKSPAAIDRVSVSSMANPRTAGRERPTVQPKLERNPYATAGLDVRLRPALERAGYPMNKYNDRFLLSIQHNAIALASGKKVFLAEGAMKDMVSWAASHLYSEAVA